MNKYMIIFFIFLMLPCSIWASDEKQDLKIEEFCKDDLCYLTCGLSVKSSYINFDKLNSGVYEHFATIFAKNVCENCKLSFKLKDIEQKYAYIYIVLSTSIGGKESLTKIKDYILRIDNF